MNRPHTKGTCFLYGIWDWWSSRALSASKILGCFQAYHKDMNLKFSFMESFGEPTLLEHKHILFFSLAYDSSHSEILLLHSSHMFCFRLRELLFCWQDILLEAHILLLRQNSKWQDYTLECTASPGQNWPSQFPLHVVNTQKTVNELNWGLYNVFSLIKLWFVLAFVIRIRQKKKFLSHTPFLSLAIHLLMIRG